MLQQLKGALDAVPLEKLPQAAREPLERLKGKVDEFFQSTRRDVRAHGRTPANPRLGPLDFSAGSDAQGRPEVNYRDGTWVAAGAHRDAQGKEVHGYQLVMFAEFQQAVMRHRGAEAVTHAGTKGLSEMRMSERMQTAVAIAYDKYMAAETKQELGEISREQLGAALVVGGTACIVARSGVRGVLGPAGTGAAIYELTRKYQAMDEVVRLCGKARTQGDLDNAPRYVGKLTGELAADGVLGIAGAAAGMVAPAAVGKADELFTRRVQGIRDTLRNPINARPVLRPKV